MPINPLDRLKSLGSLRDGILVLVSLVYVLGFSVWSVVAWQQNLGPLPVFDAQYFTAGLPPFLAICTVAALIHFSRRVFLEKWPRWLAARSPGVQMVIYGILACITFASTAAIVGANDLGLLPPSFEIRASIFIALFSILLTANLLLQPKVLYERWLELLVQRDSLPEEVAQRFRQHWGWKVFLRPAGISNLYVLLAGLGAVGVFYWASIFYLQIPQEFGGARPRCGSLDIVYSELAPETRELLAMGPAPEDSDKTIRTKKVHVFFVNKDSVLLSPELAAAAPTVEIARTAVRALNWCSRGNNQDTT